MRSVQLMIRALMLGVIAFALLAPGAFAETRMSPMMPVLKEHPLTLRQKQQITQIQRRTQTQIMAVQNNSAMTQAQKQSQYRAIHRQGRLTMMQVLTPAQQQELKARYRSSHPGAGRRHMGAGHTGTGMGHPGTAPKHTGTGTGHTGTMTR